MFTLIRKYVNKTPLNTFRVVHVKREKLLLMCCLVSSLILTGCGLTQSITDGTKEIAKDIFYKRIKVVKLDFVARSDINKDDKSQPLSVVVRVYQLKDNKSFEQLDYQTMMLSDNDMLKEDMVARRELTMRPQSAISFNAPMEEQTNYIGIVAFFRSPDKTNSTWKIILERNQLDVSKPTGIELSSNQIRLMTAEEKIVHIEEINDKITSQSK